MQMVTMFSKYATLLAFAASAIAGVIEPGTYKIYNLASSSSARSYNPFSPVYVTSSREIAGPFELWDIRDFMDGSYTIRNVGQGLFAAAPDSLGAIVKTDSKATAFNIESAGNGEYVIKLPYRDLLWNAEPPVIPRGDIKLRLPDGSRTERWIFSRVEPEDDNEQWVLLQRIGRFLRQF